MRRRDAITRVPGAAQREPKASGALQNRDRYGPWRSRISGAPLREDATRCTASGTRAIGRREFITLIGGAAVAWPLAARAQQPAMPVVGFLRITTAARSMHLLAAFRRGLGELGFVEGENVVIEYRWADFKADRLPALAADLVRRQVAVIAATDSRATVASKEATATIPIVFVFGGDPVRLGIVTSLNRPDGNVTGVSFVNTDLGAKRLGLLHELVPKAAVIAVLVDASNPEGETVTMRDAQEGARAVGRQIVAAKVAGEGDFDLAFARLVQQGAGALLVTGGPFFNGQRRRIAALALRHALPAAFNVREYVEAGGLMSYGTSQTDAYRRTGAYVGRILKGAKPAELPVLLPTKYELVINLKTARALGLQVPDRLLALADEVIE
jgi:putative ABC transport system substrate-binding protein